MAWAQENCSYVAANNKASLGNFEIFHSGEDHIVIINGGKIMKRYNGSIIFCEEKLTQVMGSKKWELWDDVGFWGLFLSEL